MGFISLIQKENHMKEYVLLYKGGDPDWMANTSEEDMAKSMEKWGEWMAMMQEKGLLASGGSPLAYTGKNLTADGVVTDVSMAELKELVTGYSIINANDEAHAIELAKDCPIFQYSNITVEIREVMQVG